VKKPSVFLGREFNIAAMTLHWCWFTEAMDLDLGRYWQENMMEDLARHNLYKYLLTVQEAARIQTTKVDPKTMSEQSWAEFCMREGAARLADEIIRRYGLDVGEN